MSAQIPAEPTRLYKGAQRTEKEIAELERLRKISFPHLYPEQSTTTREVSASEERRIALVTKKKEATEPKSALIRLYAELLAAHPREAERLGKVIADLERWQNT